MKLQINENYKPIPKVKKKNYFEGKDYLKEDTEFEEAVFSVRNIQTAQEAILNSIKLILKRKNFNIPVVMNIINDAIIAGIDDSDDVVPSANEGKKKSLFKKMARGIMSFAQSRHE